MPFFFFLCQHHLLSLCQNELRMLFTALSESKHLLLQKIAATVDRPAAKQIEVGCPTCTEKDTKSNENDYNLLLQQPWRMIEMIKL